MMIAAADDDDDDCLIKAQSLLEKILQKYWIGYGENSLAIWFIWPVTIMLLSTQFDFFLPSHDYFMFVHIDTLNMYNVYKMN